MESDPVEHVQAQAIDNEVCLFSSDDLGTRAVLRELMKSFSNNELLTLSLVSKLWKSEARALLSDRGSLTANCGAEIGRESPRENLPVLASDLQRMNAAPITISGMRLQVGLDSDEWGWPGNGRLDPTFSAILDRINWRNLSLVLRDDWEECRNSQAWLLMQKIFKDRCETLEQISLDSETSLGTQFIQEFLQGRRFPSLKTLRIELPSENKPSLEMNFLRVLVCKAPRLKKLYCNSLVTDNVLEGSSAVLVPTDEFDIYAQLSYSVLNKIRLENVALLAVTEHEFIFNVASFNRNNFNGDSFNRNMPVIFQNSRNSLKSLRINLILTLPLMSYGICFPNVRELEIQVDDRIFSKREPETVDILRAFDFTRIFPNLYKVQINVTDLEDLETYLDYMDVILRTQNVAIGEDMTDRAEKIKQLSFDGLLQSGTVKFLAAMFPHVDKISANVHNDEEVQLIREHWLDLKELDVKKIDFLKDIIQNLCDFHYDSDFSDYD